MIQIQNSQERITKEEYLKTKSWGLLTSIDLFDCDSEILRSESKIRQFVDELCGLIEMRKFGDCIVVNFGEDERVAGFSMIQLIETSCISGHFANQSNSIYIDIFSCKYYEQDEAIEFTKKFFKAREAKGKIIIMITAILGLLTDLEKEK